MADLYRGLAHKRSTLTSILDRLVARDLITRSVAESDRRSFVIVLTAKGKRVARHIHRHLSNLERAVARQVTAADIKGFRNVVLALEHEAHHRARDKRR